MSYSAIAKELGISKTSVVYHSKRLGTTGNLNEKITENQRKKNAYNRLKDYRIRQKEKAVEYKGGKCCKCGYDKCITALEFHHRNPEEKEFSFSSYSNNAWKNISKELDKCDLLCANCHRELHEELNRGVSPHADNV
jgi:5-methylcytosine-specific restriction endonuclease McrA